MRSKEGMRNLADDAASSSESHEPSSDLDDVGMLFEDLDSMKE